MRKWNTFGLFVATIRVGMTHVDNQSDDGTHFWIHSRGKEPEWATRTGKWSVAVSR